MARKNGPDTKGKLGEQSLRVPGERIVDDTREFVNMLTLTRKFAESSIGIELLKLFDVVPENIDVIFDNEGLLRTFIQAVRSADKRDMLGGAFYFFKLLAIKNPELYRECLSDDDFDSSLKEVLRSAN
jgi:hypothetical protein